jgi:hypothetical protein
MPSVRSFIISQIWNLQRLVSPRQPRLYLEQRWQPLEDGRWGRVVGREGAER